MSSAIRIRAADSTAMSAPPRGLWVEVSPGRVAELPGALCQWHTDAGPIALDEFAWGKFATGDIIQLELLRDDNPMMPDRIRVKKWRPGMRGALGAGGRAFLLVAEPYLGGGALHLGVGRWQLTLPVSNVACANAIVLNQDNEVLPVQDQTPQPGDTVLLTLVDDRVCIAGFDNWRAEADAKSPWAGHNLQLFDKPQHLIELVRLCGGSVPCRSPSGARVIDPASFRR